MPRLVTRAMRFGTLCVATALAVPAGAQTAVFEHFARYPASGQRQGLVGDRDGPPVTSTRCTGPFDPKSIPAMAEEFMKGLAPARSTRILTDTEQPAESETLGKVGVGTRTMRTRLRRVDDRTLSSETRSSINGPHETVAKSRVTHLGPCSAEAAAAESKPSAADCAELAQLRQESEAAGGAAHCAQLPPQYRAQSEGGTKMTAAAEQRCP